MGSRDRGGAKAWGHVLVHNLAPDGARFPDPMVFGVLIKCHRRGQAPVVRVSG